MYVQISGIYAMQEFILSSNLAAISCGDLDTSPLHETCDSH